MNAIRTAWVDLKQDVRTLLRDMFARFEALPEYRHTDAGVLALSALLGILVGFTVVGFHLAVAYSENFFHGFFEEAAHYNYLRYLLFPLITAFGGLLVGILRTTVFRGVPDEGLDKVHTSISSTQGTIDYRGSIKAIVTAALSIGSGGGAGREAPTVALGASVGAFLARMFRLRQRQMTMLAGAGTAAAISGIFNAPLGGMMFAVELIFGDLNLRSFVPLVIASVMSTAVVRLLLGTAPILMSPDAFSASLIDYIFLAAAGVASGGIALYFLRTFRWTRSQVRRYVKQFPEVFRPAIGGAGAGLLVAFLPSMLETTYTPVNEAIQGTGILVIAAISVLVKPVSAGLTIGSDGAGGTFAPALKVGALFGFSFGMLGSQLIPGIEPGLYALVCAAAVLGGTYRMPLTAALLVFEISRNYDLILPLIFSTVFAAFVVTRSKIPTFHPGDAEAARKYLQQEEGRLVKAAPGDTSKPKTGGDD